MPNASVLGHVNRACFSKSDPLSRLVENQHNHIASKAKKVRDERKIFSDGAVVELKKYSEGPASVSGWDYPVKITRSACASRVPVQGGIRWHIMADPGISARVIEMEDNRLQSLFLPC